MITNHARLREVRPLIHHITNYVTANDCANAVIQIGALPVMADEAEEVEEMQSISNALVLNIGTVNRAVLESMVKAGQRANKMGNPVVLDPVGVGATAFRTEAVRRIMNEVKVDIIKGNQAEIAVLAGLNAIVKGVESGRVEGDLDSAAREYAARHQTVLVITGEIDRVFAPERQGTIRNGVSTMGNISGTGCMCASLLGAFAAVESSFFAAAMSAVCCFGIAGELAAGTLPAGHLAFKTALLDRLAAVTAADLRRVARVEVAW